MIDWEGWWRWLRAREEPQGEMIVGLDWKGRRIERERGPAKAVVRMEQRKVDGGPTLAFVIGRPSLSTTCSSVQAVRRAHTVLILIARVTFSLLLRTSSRCFSSLPRISKSRYQRIVKFIG